MLEAAMTNGGFRFDGGVLTLHGSGGVADGGSFGGLRRAAISFATIRVMAPTPFWWPP